MTKLSICLVSFAGALLFVGTAFALPPCGSNTCNSQGNGYQCTINGATHTCGCCAGGPGSNGNHCSTYVGNLSGTAAEDACKAQVLKNEKKKKLKGSAEETKPVTPPRRGE